MRIIADPIAAALAHGIGTSEHRAQRVAVYDLGGGTFDFALFGNEQRCSRNPRQHLRCVPRRPGLTDGFARYWSSVLPRITRSICVRDRTALRRLRDAVERPVRSIRRRRSNDRGSFIIDGNVRAAASSSRHQPRQVRRAGPKTSSSEPFNCAEGAVRSGRRAALCRCGDRRRWHGAGSACAKGPDRAVWSQ